MQICLEQLFQLAMNNARLFVLDKKLAVQNKMRRVDENIVLGGIFDSDGRLTGEESIFEFDSNDGLAQVQ